MQISWDENEYVSHNFTLFAIFLPKIIKIGGNLTKFWQKEICTVFFLRHSVVVNIKAYKQNTIIIISKQQNDTNYTSKSQTSNLRNVHLF